MSREIVISCVLALVSLYGVNGYRHETHVHAELKSEKSALNQEVSSTSAGCANGGSASFCSGGDGWYMNRGACCKDGEYVTCEGGSSARDCEGTSGDYKKQGFKFVGDGQCCTTKWMTCETGSTSRDCEGTFGDWNKLGWKFLGSGKCCLTSASQLRGAWK